MPIPDSVSKDSLQETLKKLKVEGVVPVINSSDIIKNYEEKYAGNDNPCFLCKLAIRQLRENIGFKPFQLDAATIKPDALKYHIETCLREKVL